MTPPCYLFKNCGNKHTHEASHVEGAPLDVVLLCSAQSAQLCMVTLCLEAEHLGLLTLV